jgi:hypothetical protein
MRNIDIIALIVSVIVAFIMSIITIRKSGSTLRPMVTFFLFFGPAAILVHLGFHIGQINFNAIENIKKGTFTYDFRYYSLMLMAVAIIYCAGLLVQRLREFLEGESYGNVLRAMAMIVVVSAPTIPLNPIGALPTIACLITLSALPFAKLRKKKLVVVRKYPKATRSTVRDIEAISMLKFV